MSVEAQQVDWTDVEPICEEAFNVWVGFPERVWAKEAWTHLRAAGLTAGTTALERALAFVRFLVVASVYRDWCAAACDEALDDSPSVWLAAVDVHSFHLGQLSGKNVDIDSPDDELDDLVLLIMARERRSVVSALLTGFGGVEGLFASLHASKVCAQAGTKRRQRALARAYQAMNEPTEADLAAHAWISDGCEYLGPARGRHD